MSECDNAALPSLAGCLSFAGRPISSMCIGRWRIIGQCMRIPNLNRDCRSADTPFADRPNAGLAGFRRKLLFYIAVVQDTPLLYGYQTRATRIGDSSARPVPLAGVAGELSSACRLAPRHRWNREERATAWVGPWKDGHS